MQDQARPIRKDEVGSPISETNCALNTKACSRSMRIPYLLDLVSVRKVYVVALGAWIVA